MTIIWKNYRDRHHIVPVSRRWAISNPENIIRLKRKYHEAFHHVFGNMRPDEQLAVIIDISASALTQNFRDNVTALINNDPDYIYKDGILVPIRMGN